MVLKYKVPHIIIGNGYVTIVFCNHCGYITSIKYLTNETYQHYIHTKSTKHRLGGGKSYMSKKPYCTESTVCSDSRTVSMMSVDTQIWTVT